MCVTAPQVHYGVLQISYRKMVKITGGLSPAVKSGENIIRHDSY